AGFLTGVRLSDGGVAVTDDWSVRVFDARGRLLHTVGRRGHGPGEFYQIQAMCRTRGDTLLASDPGNNRITVLDRNGRIVRTIPLGGLSVGDNACFDDGTWIGRTHDDTKKAIRLARY